jgi:hypothetical protein
MSDVDSRIPHRTKIGVLPLLGGILALAAEATVMVALMVMAGICTLGSIIWWLIDERDPRRRTAP